MQCIYHIKAVSVVIINGAFAAAQECPNLYDEQESDD
jgi:hypothetical protein